MIALRGVKKRYRDGAQSIFAVKDVSLEIAAGSFVALRGPSGSGKTTVLGLIGGMIAPTEGAIEIDGHELSHMRDHHRTELRRKYVGFVFQELALIHGMSVLENVLLPLVPTGGANKADVSRAKSLLDRVGIGDRAASASEKLSGGQRQRAAIARALILDAKVLLLDEPTAHLDAENASSVLTLLCELRSEGRTIVAATHDPRVYDDARIDRVVAMSDGRIVD
jgi:putative ABC transport system ATP-binding protein